MSLQVSAIELNQILYIVSMSVTIAWCAFAPFTRKLSKGEIAEWDHKYTVIAVASWVACLLATFILYAIHPLQVEDPVLVVGSGIAVGLASKPTLEELLKEVVPGWFD